MSRELGGFQDGGYRQQTRRPERRSGRSAFAGGREDGGDVARSVSNEQEDGRPGQGRVTQPRDDKLFPRCPNRLDTIRVEQQQAVQAEAGGDPGDHQQQEVARLHQQ